jgi:hypothetical protein
MWRATASAASWAKGWLLGRQGGSTRRSQAKYCLCGAGFFFLNGPKSAHILHACFI